MPLYQLCIIHQMAALGKVAYNISKKVQTLNKPSYDKHFWFELCFAAVHYLFVDRDFLKACATAQTKSKGYFKRLLLCTEPYQVINVWPENVKRDQHGV